MACERERAARPSLNFKIIFVFGLFDPADRDAVPHALVDVVQENFGEQFHAADGEHHLILPVMMKLITSVSMLPVTRHEIALIRLR